VNITLRRFAGDVGTDDPVAVEGGRTQWGVGGVPAEGCRFVQAPVGVVTHQPAEMTVRVGAGTTVAELHHALGQHDQTTILEGPPDATVGGLLAVGHSGIRRLRHGPVRDALLEARYVSAAGRLVTAGGPTVKNVTGFDLCRLLVGSLGTIGLIGEVVLRTRPAPEASQWLAAPVAPEVARSSFFRPASILWDGDTTWVLLEGHGVDVEAEQVSGADIGFKPVDGPPELPPHRWSVPPSDIRARRPTSGRYVAEIGVGMLHCDAPAPPVEVAEPIVALHRRLKDQFDPEGRLNPGRDPLQPIAGTTP
jgi:glycolate oxidase FAD binding subunit